MSAVARLPVPNTSGDGKVELICPSGHRTIHSLERVLRLNDGWCGRCGAGISYKPVADGQVPQKAKSVRAVKDGGDAVLSRSAG